MISWLRLPFWVGWVPVLLDAALGALLCGLAAWLAIGLAAWPWRRLREGSWQEQARRAYPIRVACWVALLLPFACAALAFVDAGTLGPASRTSAVLTAAATAVAGPAAVVPQRLRAERRILGATLPTPGWWRLSPRPVAGDPSLLAGHAGGGVPDAGALRSCRLRVAGADGLPPLPLDQGGRRATGLPPGARTAGLAAPPFDRGARRRAHGTPPVPAFEWPALHALAFAFPSMPSLVVSHPALAALSDEQRRRWRATSSDTSPSLVALLAERSASVAWPPALLAALRPLVGFLDWGPYLVFSILLVAYGRLAVRRFRRLEERQPTTWPGATSRRRGSYARALARLYEINRIPAVLLARPRSHPHLHDRRVAAAAVPAEPPPQPPSRARGFAALLGLACSWVG